MPEFGPRRQAGLAEDAWAALKGLEANGLLEIYGYRRIYGKPDYELAPRVRMPLEAEDRLRTLIGQPRKGPSPQQLWRAALELVFGQGDPAVERLAGFRMPFIEGRSLEDLARQLAAFRANPLPDGIPLRTASCYLFWGDSKVLDTRPELLPALLGPERSRYPEMPVHLNVQITDEHFRDVLLIENQETFDLVCGVVRRFSPAPVVICTHGFRATAQRIRSPAACRTFYSIQGRVPEGVRRFEAWLFRQTKGEDPHVWFWGDLDWEGLKILRSLREAFVGARAWETGYTPMVKRLRTNFGHRPEQANKQGQREIEATGCLYADQTLRGVLLETGRFCDQEVVLEKELLAQVGLTDSTS